MIRYVDAGKLWEEIESEDVYTDFQSACIFKMVREKINNAPTADVEEVRHGEWRLIEEDVDGNGNNQYRCSLCEAGELHAPFVIVPYCWKCGAKMDEEKEE